MDARFGSHAADQGEFVRVLGQIRHDASELVSGFGGNRSFGTLSRPIFGIQGIDVSHPSQHLQEDDILGLAEAAPRDGFHGGYLSKKIGQYRDAERGLGPTFAECAARDGIEFILKVHEDRS